MGRIWRGALLLAFVVLAVGTSAASAAPAWVTPVSNLTAAGPPLMTLQFASNARGDVAVAWIDPSSQEIFESDRAAGGTFSTGTAVSVAAGQQLGSIALDNSGNVYVFFGTDQGTPSASRPRVATRQVGTSTWTVTPLANADAVFTQLTPIGAVTASGRAMAVWQQGDMNGAEHSVFEFSVKNAGSSTWSSKADIPNTGFLGDATHASAPVLAINSSGDAALVYPRTDAGFVNTIVWGTTFNVGTGTWTSANTIMADVGSDTLQGSPVVGIDTSGQATAAWVRNNNGPHNVVQFATKQLSASSWPAAPSGNSMTAGANDLTAPAADASQPSIALEPDGTTTIAWERNGANEQRTRAAGGSTFAAAAGIPTTLTTPGPPTLATGPNGGVIATFTGMSGASQTVGLATRASGAGSFTPQPNLPGAGNGPALAGIDDQGNVPAVWINTVSGQSKLQATALDVAAPTISNVTFPATAVAGTQFAYSATVADRWSTVSASWAFGDAATGPVTGTHTYSAAGSFLATLTATDGVGNSAQVTKTIQVSPAPAGGGGGGGGGGGPTVLPGPTAAPAITALHLSPTSFKAAPSGGSIAAAKTGTTISYRISQPSTTTFTVQQPAPGVRKGRLCVAPPKHKGKHKPKACKRFVNKGTFRHLDTSAGAVSFRFTGRINGHKLGASSYRLQAIGVNAKGSGSAVFSSFKIVKR